MKATYLGPADVFSINGKEHKIGDSIASISAESLRHHMRAGHRFDVEVDGSGVTQPATLAQANTERGEVPASVTDAANANSAVSAGIGQVVSDVPADTTPATGSTEKKP